MDEEAQDTGFDSDSEKVPFFDAVNGEDTEESYKEEFLPVGTVPEDETAAVDENPIANATVDPDENVDTANNLPSVDDVPPDHFIYQYDLDKMNTIELKESIKARGLNIAGKKSDLKLQLQQAVPAGVQIIPEEGTQQPHNQTEGLHPAAHWGELKHIDEPVYSPDYYE